MGSKKHVGRVAETNTTKRIFWNKQSWFYWVWVLILSMPQNFGVKNPVLEVNTNTQFFLKRII
jgi:hypothetical protein